MEKGVRFNTCAVHAHVKYHTDFNYINSISQVYKLKRRLLWTVGCELSMGDRTLERCQHEDVQKAPFPWLVPFGSRLCALLFGPPPNNVPRPTCRFFCSDLSFQFQGEPGNLLAWGGPGPPALALPRRVTLKVDESDQAVRAGDTTWKQRPCQPRTVASTEDKFSLLTLLFLHPPQTSLPPTLFSVGGNDGDFQGLSLQQLPHSIHSPGCR